MAQLADVTIIDQGTVVLFQVNTDSAKEFVDENVQVEGWQWMGNRGFVVDHRYAQDLIEGMKNDGLLVD